MDYDRIGANIWGTATALLSLASLFVVIAWGWNLGPDGSSGLDPSGKIHGMYAVLKDCGSVVAGILGFSGLAWAHFYTEVKKAAVAKKVVENRAREEQGAAETTETPVVHQTGKN